jgi:predicted small lipoprotein YifL
VRRLAVLAVLLFAVAGCRDGAGSAPPADRPASGVQQQLDDVESTLDSIESELNAG